MIEVLELTRKQIDIEISRCRDFLYFLRYCKIVEAPTLDSPGGVIDFELWPHLLVAIKALLKNLLISCLKSRQVGWSYLLAAYSVWYAVNHRGAKIMLFSKGEDEAMELLGKTKRIYNHLPDWLKLKLDPDSAKEMGFPTMESSIKAFAATQTAGISYTASVVVCDEHDEHPYADENYMSSKPTRDAGGQFISVFTANPDPNTLAKAIFRDAVKGKNDFLPLFFEYDVRPGRDIEWYEHTKRNIPERELAKLSPELYMFKNYPRTIEEALSIPSSIAVFDSKVLNVMMEQTRNPMKIEADIDQNIIHIYKPFMIGEFYICTADTAHGVGGDYSTAGIMNVKTLEVVADIFSSVLSTDEFALHIFSMCALYKNPKCYVEDNDWGRTVINTMMTLGYRNWGYQDEKRTEGKEGWHTDKKSRYELFGKLTPAINNNQVTIYNSAGLKQFYDVIRNPKKDGRIEASSGRHDDYPIMVGICLAKRHEVDISFGPMEIISTVHFRR